MTTQVRNYFPVTGRNTSQEVFDRLPVQELAADHPYQWTLFVLGWAYLKDTPIPFPGVVQPPLRAITSLMELGGIHGKPYREWAGDIRTPAEAQIDFSYLDKKDMNPSPSRFGGELTHILFRIPSNSLTRRLLPVCCIERCLGILLLNCVCPAMQPSLFLLGTVRMSCLLR